MAYITVENFKFGLDARRSELTSLPGTLILAENCHINQGAEIEKRKAFVLMAGSPISPLAEGFGLEVDETLGPVFFVQVNNTVTGPINQITLELSVGDPFIAVVASTNFAGTPFAVVKTTSGKYIFFYKEPGASFANAVGETWLGVSWFNTGIPAVIASQIANALLPLTNNNYTIALSGGSTVITTVAANYTQPASGATVIVQVVSNTGIHVGDYLFIITGGNYVVTAVNVDGIHITVQNLGYAGNAVPTTVIVSPQNIYPASYVTITAPLNQTYSLRINVTSAAGQIIDTFLGQGQPSVPAVAATGMISINAGATSGSFTQIAAPNGSGGFVNLLANPVLWTTDNITTAALLAQQINQTITTPKYNATVQANVVTIIAPTTPTGAYYNGLNLQVSYNPNTGDNMDFNSTSGLPLTVSVTPLTAAATVSLPLNPAGSVGISPFITCLAQNGTAPYKFTWTATEPIYNGTVIAIGLTNPIEIGNVAGSISASSSIAVIVSSNQLTTGSLGSNPPTHFTAKLQCTVSDSATPALVSSTIEVLIAITL